MIISDTKNFVFIHTPKAAGTSVRESLHQYATVPVWQHRINNLPVGTNRLLSKHASAKTIKKYLGEEQWNKFFTFTFVRNPWDRVVSTYFYAKKYKGDAKHKLASQKTFTEFVKWYGNVCTPRHPEPLQLLPQMYYIGDNGRILVDFVGRFESFQKDFRNICERIGIKTKLNHANKTDHASYRELYNRSTREIVGRLFKEDIRILGYTF